MDFGGGLTADMLLGAGAFLERDAIGVTGLVMFPSWISLHPLLPTGLVVSSFLPIKIFHSAVLP